MSRPFIALGVVTVLIVAAGLGYVLGIGPLARPAAAGSVVFVAISRTGNDAEAREIEVVDLDTGTHGLFDAGGPITAMALSADRRSLYVALDGGKIVLLDATTGSQYGLVTLGRSPVVSLAPTADGRTLFAVAVTNTQTSVIAIDLGTGKAGEPIALPPTSSGRVVIRDDALVVPFNDAQGLEVAFIDVNSRVVRSRLTIPRHSLGAPAAFPIGDALVGVVALDSASSFGPGIFGIHVYVLTDVSHWHDVEVFAPHPEGPFGPTPQAASADGAIHVCATVDQGPSGVRYVITSADLIPTSVASDCGLLAGGGQILMLFPERAQLWVLDAKTGKTIRTPSLAGVPALLVQ